MQTTPPVDVAFAIIQQSLRERAPGMVLEIGRLEATRESEIRMSFTGNGVARVPDADYAGSGGFALARHVDTLYTNLQRQALDALGLDERIRAIQAEADAKVAAERGKVIEEVRRALAFQLCQEDQRRVAHALDEIAKPS